MYISSTSVPKPARPRRSGLVIAGVLAVVLGLATALPAVAATTSAADKPLIVGLGDSFTSGVGTTGTDADSGVCRRGFDSYPLVAAELLGARGANAACSGAPVSAITQPFSDQRPQVDRIGEADAVVMTIGGNDVLTLANASQALIDDGLVADDLATLEPALADAFTAVKQAAPEGTPVLVLAYPDFFPETATGTCSSVAQTITPQAHRSFDQLNGVVEEQAKAAGLEFVDASDAFAGHDICSDEPWVTGLDQWDVALHPNTAGHAALGKLVAEQLSNSRTTQTTTSSTTQPIAPPSSETASTSQGDPDVKVLGAPTTADHEGHATATTAATPSDDEAGESREATTTSEPQLASTGASTPLMVTTGFSLVGLGLALIWLQMRLELNVSTAVVRSSATRRR